MPFDFTQDERGEGGECTYCDGFGAVVVVIPYLPRDPSASLAEALGIYDRELHALCFCPRCNPQPACRLCANTGFFWDVMYLDGITCKTRKKCTSKDHQHV